ncbi:hypothetical protein HUJ04_008481 [Dendroctonus ponderosae]|nr:hypothetical protein HUJ04_008481 [Dendroctonus ponderosae]KAH1008387.1 hypothetical protein HUJ05_008942 [Dendroctonus ponderosae]
MYKLLVFVALLVAALASPAPAPKANPLGLSAFATVPLAYSHPYVNSYSVPTVYSAPLSYASVPYSAPYSYAAYPYVL